MSNFDLKDYKTVAERITEAKKVYPEGRFQTELLTLSPGLAEKYVAVKARFFRTENDVTPGEGVAWELVPGKTPYTKDSELQNCETSAWGRALVAAFAVDASKGIASREEVQRQQSEPRPRSGGQKRTPSNPPERTPSPTGPSQGHVKAPTNDLSPDVAAEVKRMKNWAFQQLGKDADKTKEIWGKVIETYEMNGEGMPNAASLQFIESDLSIAVGEALVAAAELVPEVEGSEPFEGTLRDSHRGA